MEQSTITTKRSARPRVIKLNGSVERVELILLSCMMPLWGGVLPWLAFNQIMGPLRIGFPWIEKTWGLFLAGLILLGCSFLCCLHFLHLFNNKFEFEASGIRLPGVDHRLLSYTSLHRIYKEKSSPLLIAIDFSPKSIFGREKTELEVSQFVEIKYLTKDSAGLLLSLFDNHLTGCDISQEVRDLLANWPAQKSKPKSN